MMWIKSTIGIVLFLAACIVLAASEAAPNYAELFTAEVGALYEAMESAFAAEQPNESNRMKYVDGVDSPSFSGMRNRTMANTLELFSKTMEDGSEVVQVVRDICLRLREKMPIRSSWLDSDPTLNKLIKVDLYCWIMDRNNFGQQ